MFEGVWTSVVENAGLNLIGAFAGSLNVGARPGGSANPLAGGVGAREAMGNFAANLRTGFGANTFNASSGVGMQSAGGLAIGAPTVVAGAAMGGAADPLNVHNQPHSQETRGQNASKDQTRVGGEVRGELASHEATGRRNGRNTAAPSAPFQFDPTRR